VVARRARLRMGRRRRWWWWQPPWGVGRREGGRRRIRGVRSSQRSPVSSLSCFLVSVVSAAVAVAVGGLARLARRRQAVAIILRPSKLSPYKFY